MRRGPNQTETQGHPSTPRRLCLFACERPTFEQTRVVARGVALQLIANQHSNRDMTTANCLKKSIFSHESPHLQIPRTLAALECADDLTNRAQHITDYAAFAPQRFLAGHALDHGGGPSGASGWPSAPAPKRAGGCCHRRRSPLRTTDRKLPGAGATAR